ncbi:kinase-like domain-containing protein [Nemania diffusa]|nr:kinase-like domain-containing protein [Nemania diffusa]
MGTPFNRADSGFNRPEYQGRGPNLADQYGQHRVPRRFQEAISYYNGRLNLQTLVDCLRAIWPNETEKTLDIHISLRRVLQHSSFRDREFGLCYRFAFKSYSQQYQGFYEIEKNAFNGVMDEKNMIKCLGTVQCVENPQSPSSTPPRSYNILLEYGEDDLNEYFIVHSPPTLGSEILDFWGNLFQIAEALRKVHNLETKTNNGNLIRFEGCHADVKPDNILRVQGNFKLADFGFAKFMPGTVGSGLVEEATTSLVGGTATYGAPEFFQMNRGSLDERDACTVTNTIDTWSFACVVSVAATWVVLGLQGIKQFQAVRIAAPKKIKSNPKATIQNLLYDDTFHDGFTVLQDVINWHHYLRQVTRKSDPISHRLLDLIDKEVLGQTRDNRLTSDVLYNELMRLLKDAKNDIHEKIAESIIESMISFDKAAPSTMKDMKELEKQLKERSIIQLEADGSKQAEKSVRLTNIPATKVAHRQILEATRSQTSLNKRDFHSSKKPESLAALVTPSFAESRIHQEYLSLQHKTRLRIGSLRRPKEYPYLSNFIKDRDIKFIVDNGTSMRERFDHAKETLLVLAEKVAALDEDGVDLLFTFADKKLGCENERDPWMKFNKAMTRASERILTDPQRPLDTDMARTLGEIFQKYEKSGVRKRITLIILTDGIWGGSIQPNEVEQKIAQFFRRPKRTGNLEDRPFTIQFVSFSDSATDRFNALDDDMQRNYGIPDVIDHEPCTGDPNKMILGSMENIYDVIPTSPPGNQQETLTIQPSTSPGLFRRLSAISMRGNPE